jgi:hypothetical protein
VIQTASKLVTNVTNAIITTIPKGERLMLERNKLDGFYQELQTPTRIQANTRSAQVQEFEEDVKSQLTQS